jgi:hypothetical protein
MVAEARSGDPISTGGLHISETKELNLFPACVCQVLESIDSSVCWNFGRRMRPPGMAVCILPARLAKELDLRADIAAYAGVRLKMHVYCVDDIIFCLRAVEDVTPHDAGVATSRR